MVGYLTPETLPPGLICRALFIPNSEDWIAVVTGALEALIQPASWQKQGALTPEEAAAGWFPLFDDFVFQNRGGCRVVGEIVTTAGSASPNPDWLECDGASLLRSSFPDLFAVIGTTYGSVDGTHFNIPDLRGRTAIGSGHGTGLTDRPLGTSLGEETHTLIIAEIPSHNHLDPTPANIPFAVTPGPTPLFVGYTPSVTGSAGGNGAHNTMQPSLALKHWIVTK